MKTVQIEFSKYELVNFLWPELIEEYGFDKARKIVSQAIDLQKMNGTNKSTCLLYTSPSPRDRTRSRMPSSA